MPIFNELLRRVSQSRRGVYAATDEIDTVSAWNVPVAVRAWRAWAEAEGAFERRDLHDAVRWLHAAAEWSGDATSEPFRGEMSLLWARVLDAADEPRRAMPYAEDAWVTWFALARNPLPALDGSALTDLLQALVHPEHIDVPLPQAFLQWMTDRASPNLHRSAAQVFAACRALGDGTAAYALADEWREWYRASAAKGTLASNQIAVLEAHLVEDVATLRDQLGEPQAALDGYLEARALLETPGVSPDPTWLRQFVFNIGNQHAKLGQHAEAIAAFEEAAAAFAEAGQEEAAIRARHAILVSQWKGGEHAAHAAHAAQMLPALEDVLCGYERLIAADDAAAGAAKQNLHQGNLLWLSLASRLRNDGVDDERFLHQLFATRQRGTRAHTTWQQAQATSRGVPTVIDEMSVLLARLADESPGLVVLSLESGVDELLAVTLVGGGGPLATRLSVERLSAECLEVLGALIQVRRGVTLDLASKAIAATSNPGKAFREACAAFWTHLPDETRRRLSTATVVYFVPEPTGGLDEVPLELLHDGTTFLGLRVPIVRVASWAQMPRALARNFVDHVPLGRAAVVRGPDVPVLGELWLADDEVVKVEQSARETFSDVRAVTTPSADDFLALLAEGLDVLHFTGHSYADDGGEYLVVGGEARLGVPEIGAPRPQPAPAAILCSCLVGLHRATRAGMARGIAGGLLDAGSPGVVAAMVSLPDQVGHDFALAVHFHAKTRPLCEAVMAARLTLSRRFHPAAWGCFAYFGRHDARLAPISSVAAPTWPALLIRALATRGTMWRPELGLALAADASLSGELRANAIALLDAYVAGTRDALVDAVDSASRLAADRRLALTAAAALVAIVCDSDDARARKAAGRALLIQGITDDTYLQVAIVDAAIRRGLLDVQDESGTRLVERASVMHGWLSRSGEGLRAAREALDDLRAQWSSRLTLQVHEMFDVTPEVFQAADAGDRTAQKEMVWVMMAREASPAALASDLPWTHWLYRVMGSDAREAIADFCGVVDAGARSGRLEPTQAAALRTILKRYLGPGEIEPEHVAEALDAFAGDDQAKETIEQFQLYDRITSQEREVDASEIQLGTALAAAAGASGLAAFLALQLGARAMAAGEPIEAKPIAEWVLGELQLLADADPVYEGRANLAAVFLYQVAQATGDQGFEAAVLQEHRPRIEAFLASRESDR